MDGPEYMDTMEDQVLDGLMVFMDGAGDQLLYLVGTVVLVVGSMEVSMEVVAEGKNEKEPVSKALCDLRETLRVPLW
jgi:hypothetical protein